MKPVGPCTKVPYTDATVARKSLAAMRHRARQAKEESGAYKCPICGWWHLTSRPWRPRRKK